MEFANVHKSLQKKLSVYLPEELAREPIYFLSIVTAIVVLLLTTIVWFFLFRRKSIRNAILILGLSDSGKTLLFSKLVAAKNVTTYTSMKANVSTVTCPNQKKKKVQLVDVPGSERLRSKFLDEYLPMSRGIVFVVDSLNFQKEMRDVASYLYAVLQERSVQKSAVPLLVVCNKQDHAVAKSAKVIQSQLEKEMNAVRQTQTGQLSATSPDEANVYLGQKGKEFQFVDLKPVKVEFTECSALESGEGLPSDILPQIWTWIAKVA